MKIHQKIMICAEMRGYPIGEMTAAAMERKLRNVPEEALSVALDRLSERSGRLTYLDVKNALPGSHRSPDEAWAIMSRAFDEGNTVVCTEQMMDAFGEVRHMTDMVAARMAFKECYNRKLNESYNKRAVWFTSYGHDPSDRVSQVRSGVEAGILEPGYLRDVMHLASGSELNEIQKAMTSGLSKKMSLNGGESNDD